jgi:hypothetical protein
MNATQNSTEPSAAQAGTAPLSNRRDWKYFDEKLAELRVNDVENIIARGRILIEAHEELERGSYEGTVKGHFDLSYARKLRIIAAHPVLSNRSHANALPPHPETLYQLTKLPAEMLRAKLAEGSITPKLERKEVASWRKGEGGKVAVGGKTVERKSLREQLKAAETEIKTLEAKLKSAGGSLFDLKADGVKEIAEVIAATVPESKASALASAITAALKERKRSRQAPAE